MDFAIGTIVKFPIDRIADGIVELGSTFAQVNNASIVMAVQAGYVQAVEKEPSQWFLALTEKGKKWYEKYKTCPATMIFLSIPVENTRIVKFSDLAVGDRFQLVMETGTPYKPVFVKLNDDADRNSEVNGITSDDRFVSFASEVRLQKVGC